MVDEIFAIVARINAERGVAMLLVEQNAMAAFGIAAYGYIMENAASIDGPTERLVADRTCSAYLGYGETTEVASFRDVKHYKRRKRWLS
jgi:branched-chain amino acid transport system ATP-binding protein